MKFASHFRIHSGEPVHLMARDPDDTAGVKDKAAAAAPFAKAQERIAALQEQLYAEGRQALLVILQAMDAGGKDGTIRHVFGRTNPQGMKVASFKQPTPVELAHDFLWRVHTRAPANGEIAVFNRSHYEDVLVVRVHDLVPKAVWSQRYEQINAFESLLAAAGTRIVKFYLHIDPAEQLKRFGERLDDPARNWKIAASDYTERKLWPDYLAAYEAALEKTSTDHAPWFVIPANHKWFRNLAIASIVVETLEDMRIRLPRPGLDLTAVRAAFEEARREQVKHDTKGR